MLRSSLLLLALLLATLPAQAQPFLGTTTFDNNHKPVRPNGPAPATGTIDGYAFTVAASVNAAITNASETVNLINTPVGSSVSYLGIASSDGSEFMLSGFNYSVLTATYTNLAMTITGYRDGTPVQGAVFGTTTPATASSTEPTNVSLAGMSAFGIVDEIRITFGGAAQGTFKIYDITIDAALPVELTSFTATLDGAQALLRWTTASETNNAGFDVEHRSAGSAFRTVGFTAGRGTTAEASSYAHAVEGLQPGTHTFRLKQVDFDGAFEYSPEVELTLRAEGLSLAMRAVGTGIEGFVAVPQGVARVEVFDALGRRVAVEETTGAFAIEAPLASGVYVVRVEAGSQVITRSVVVAR